MACKDCISGQERCYSFGCLHPLLLPLSPLSAFLGLPRDASLDGCAQGLAEGLCFSLGRAQGEMGKSLGPGESLAGQRDEAGQGLPPSARAKGKGRT